jgi:hypothetical protein
MRLVETFHTCVRETHEILCKKGEEADVYTLSDLTKAEHVTHVTHAHLEDFAKRNLEMPVVKSHASSTLPLFLPMDDGNTVRATAANATANDYASPENKTFSTLHCHLQALSTVGSREPTPV